MQGEKAEAVIVHAVVDDALSPDFQLWVELEVFVRREDAERFHRGGAWRTIPSLRQACGSRSGSLEAGGLD